MFSNFLLAYDGTREGREALHEATLLAKRMGAAVHLLSVVRLTPGELMAEGALAGAILGAEEERSRKILNEGIERLKRDGLPATGTLTDGPSPARDIADVARRIGADLIVIGHHDRNFLARLWHGSVGEQLIAEAPCSVLVAISPAAANKDASASAPATA
jgi:nucleotide-binding universal stress UspA family protein